jgi:phosphoribosylformylglycinamidine synthase
VVLVGAVDTVGPVNATIGAVGTAAPRLSLAGSRWAARQGHLGGRLPNIDFELHARLLSLVVGLVGGPDPKVDGVHDVSDGGIGVALAEMAVHSSCGFRVGGIHDHQFLFGEGPSRVLLSVPPQSVGEVQALADAAGVGAVVLGEAGGDRLIVEGLVDLALAEAEAAWSQALPAALGAANP